MLHYYLNCRTTQLMERPKCSSCLSSYWFYAGHKADENHRRNWCASLSYTRLCATNVKSEIKGNYDVNGLVKPGAGAGILVNIANSDIKNLTKNNVVIICGGANDVAKINSKTALRHIRNFIKSNNLSNIILVSVPHRHDLIVLMCKQ